MNIEPTNEADVVCKDLIGEAYEAAYKRYPDFGGFSGLDALWYKIQEALDQKDALDMCTTEGEDAEAQDILAEVFEEACRTAKEDYKYPGDASEYVDYKQLWERICAVIGVKV